MIKRDQMIQGIRPVIDARGMQAQEEAAIRSSDDAALRQSIAAFRARMAAAAKMGENVDDWNARHNLNVALAEAARRGLSVEA